MDSGSAAGFGLQGMTQEEISKEYTNVKENIMNDKLTRKSYESAPFR